MTTREVARAESARGELVLRERYGEAPAPVLEPVLELRANGAFVMDTLETATERALATSALDLLPSEAGDLEVLVGGLGLGFTAHQVLADHRVTRCRVVEIEDALVTWLRDGTVPHGPALMADQRLEVTVADVADALAEAPDSSYDLVLLDVDNGPDQLVHEVNARLYQPTLLRAARRVLRPGGALAVWSADAAPALVAAMRDAFGRAEEVAVPVVLQGRDESYWLYTGRA